MIDLLFNQAIKKSSWGPGVTADVLKEAQLLDSELKWTIRTTVMPPLAAEL